MPTVEEFYDESAHGLVYQKDVEQISGSQSIIKKFERLLLTSCVNVVGE